MWERPFLPEPPSNLSEENVVAYMKKITPYIRRAESFPLAQINEFVRYVSLFAMHTFRIFLSVPYFIFHSLYSLATMNKKMMLTSLLVGGLVPWCIWLFINIPVSIWLKQNAWIGHLFQSIDVSDDDSKAFYVATLILYVLCVILFVGLTKGSEYVYKKIEQTIAWI